MCCMQFLQILTYITAVVIHSSESLDYGNNKQILANDKKLRDHDMIYGQMLSELEESNVLRDEEATTDFDGRFRPAGLTWPAILTSVQWLKGSAGIKPKLLHKSTMLPKSSQCTTTRPISGELMASGDSEEVTSSPNSALVEENDDDDDNGYKILNNKGEALTDTEYITASPKSASGDENNDDDNEEEIPSDKDYRGGEIRGESDGSQNPSKDDDYDVTVSTKKYDGPREVYFPDHYLDDA